MIKIFNPTDTNFSSCGNIIINPTKCIETRKKSLNGWYIDVEVPIKYSQYLEQDMLCVIKSKSKVNPQAFRIKNIEKKQRKIVFQARHVMFDSEDYFLLDVRPTDKNGQNVLSYVNERTDKTSPFTVYSNVSTQNTAYFIRKNMLEAWETIEERWGGAFDADNWNVSLLSQVGNDNGETIMYGKNLQGISVFEDWSNVVTKLYPVGYDGIMLPEVYLESDVQYDEPYTKTIDFETELEDEDLTDANLITELRTNATAYLNENKVPKISYTIDVNVNETLMMGDTVHIKHPLCNISAEVLEYEYNVISKKTKSITVGNYSRDVKNKFNAIKENVNEIAKKVSNQEVVIAEQTEMINSLNKNGYVYIDDNEILILDALPKSSARNVWRFGLGGIGFSSNGYEGPFGIAMTMDGQINANFITTGTLNVSRINGLSDELSNIKRSIEFNEDNIDAIVEKNDELSNEVAELKIGIGGITSRVSSTETKIQTVENTSISNVDVQYALGTSTTTAPTTGWSTTAPQWQQGKYMWQRTDITYANGTTETGTPTCISGAKGDTGATGSDGDTGIGVSAIEEQYYLSTSNTTQTGGSWKTTQDTWIKGKYIWTRSKITWTDNSVTYTDPILATGLNNANSIADTANSKVDNLKIGGTQLLRGTNTVTELTTTGTYSEGTWRSASGGTGTRTSIDISNSPNANIKKGWELVSTNGNVDICQDKVPVISGVQYTMSCYAKGTGSLKLQYGNNPYPSKSFAINSEWTKYSFTFTIGENSDGVSNSLCNMYFGTQGVATIQICGMKLEQGNVATDWMPAPEDTEKKFDEYSTIEQTKDSITQTVNKIRVDTDNLLLNTALKEDASNFTLGSGVTRVTDKLTPNKNYCFKYDISGLTTDAWRSADPTKVDIIEGEVVTASANVFIPSGVENSRVCLEIQCFNSSNDRISMFTENANLEWIDVWQNLSVTATLPEGTVSANARVWIQRNGKIWVGDLKLGKGNTKTSWCPSSKDYSTTGTVRSMIKQTANSIDLNVTDEAKTVGIKITLKDGDGNELETKTGTIDMSGLVTFTDLSRTGSTTINGSNITTGTISADRIDLSGYLTVGVANSTYDAKGSANSARTNAVNDITNKLSTSGATVINGDNITTGHISANHIDMTGTSSTSEGTVANGIHVTSPSWLAGNVPSPSGGSRNPIVYFGAINTSQMANPLASVGAEFWDNGEAYIRRLYCESGASANQYMGYIKTTLSTSSNSINYIVNGTSKINVNTYNGQSFDIYASTSDEQLKENIVDSNVEALDVINKIRLISFNWKDSGEYQAMGFSAQQLKTVCEDFVSSVKQPENSEYDEILQVRDFNMQPYIIGAIQELYKKLEDIENKL